MKFTVCVVCGLQSVVGGAGARGPVGGDTDCSTAGDDSQTTIEDSKLINAAVFYSITSTQRGAYIACVLRSTVFLCSPRRAVVRFPSVVRPAAAAALATLSCNTPVHDRSIPAAFEPSVRVSPVPAAGEVTQDLPRRI
jgi:hypothetical protein